MVNMDYLLSPGIKRKQFFLTSDCIYLDTRRFRKYIRNLYVVTLFDYKPQVEIYLSSNEIRILRGRTV